jgi:iron complex outermembrane receptor protein
MANGPWVGRSECAGTFSKITRVTYLSSALTAATFVTSGSALAQEDGGAIELEPITVTGEKTLRLFEDTASSVSVLTDEDLRERPGLATLDEALSQLPNVFGTGTGNFAPQIRGSDTTGPANGVTAFIAGTRPRTTVQLDGRPLTYNEFVFGQTGLWDVERVEVFRGPQTTLQGRNSIAGAITIDTKDPTFEYEAGGRAIVGNYDTRQFSGVVSGPIVEDQLAFRVSADRRDHESFVDVVRQPIGVDDIEEEEATNARAKLLFLPLALPDFSAKLTFNHADTRQPQVEFVNEPFDERRLTSDEPGQFPLFETQANSDILDLNYFLTPQIELRNTATYSDVQINRLTDPGSGIAEILADEFSNETILEYTAPEHGLRGIIGTYYFNAETDEKIDISGGTFDDDTQTAAVFGEGTVTFFDKLDVTLGARYEREKRERVGSLGPFVIGLDETFDAFLPKLGIAYRPSDRFTYGATVQRGFNAGGAGIAFVPPFPSFTFDEEFVWNYEAFFRSR